MPARRSHKKSRAGCRRCKVRKVKCDEIHPRCGNCEKHGVVCDFETLHVAEDLASTSTPSLASPISSTPATLALPNTESKRWSSSGLSPATPRLLPRPTTPRSSREESPVSRLMELRLMHQYTHITSKTLLANTPVSKNIWQTAVPEMAFEGRTYLADAILSMAALHLRSENPQDKALVRASHAYAASTLTEYRASLDNGITADNAEALFLTASLIAIQSVASRIFAKDDAASDSGDPNARYALPLPWFHAFQGVKTIVATSWIWIRNSSIVKTVIDSQPSLQLDLNPLGPTSFFGHLLEGMEEELAGESSQHVQTTSQCYSHAICVLNWAHKSAFPAASLAFPATVARRFIELVEAKRPRALAILACFFALLKRMDDVWWLQDVAKREVMGLVSLFESGSKWWRHLEWPIRIALWDGNNIPIDVWGADCDAEATDTQGFVSHIELMAELMGQSPDRLSTAITPPLGEHMLTAESPD